MLAIVRNKWIEETCWHGIRFADYSCALSHKDNAEGYKPDFDSLIREIGYGLPHGELDKFDLTYEMRYEACSYLTRNGGHLLMSNKLISSKHSNPEVIMKLLKKETPHLQIFQDFSLDSPIETMPVVHFEFDLLDQTLLPNTENIILQVVITDQPVYSGTKIKSEDLDIVTRPLCASCKQSNIGLITLHTSKREFHSCSLWENGLSVHFNTKLKPKFSIQDERFFVLEQFIRQFKLWEKYK